MLLFVIYNIKVSIFLALYIVCYSHAIFLKYTQLIDYFKVD